MTAGEVSAYPSAVCHSLSTSPGRKRWGFSQINPEHTRTSKIKAIYRLKADPALFAFNNFKLQPLPEGRILTVQ